MVTRRKRKGAALALLLGTGAMVAGCWPYDPTDDLVAMGYVCDDGSQRCFHDSSTTTTTVDPGCVPGTNQKAIEDTCGVFVSSSKGNDTTGEGTKAKPYATLKKALASASDKGKPVYACSETFTEALSLEVDATMYGAMDCTADWTYAGEKRTTWTAANDEVPLHVVIGARLALQNVALVAADAKAPGGSSIAVIAEGGTQIALSHCDVTAGNGANGAEGETPADTGTPGVDGDSGVDGCGAVATNSGGLGGQNTCEATDVGGGLGGSGTSTSAGGNGSNGIPIGADGMPGAGQSSDGQPNTMCTNGGDGAEGQPGDPGAGASDSANGTLSPSGYTGASGSDGASNGTPGQGGGGGGGAKKCANTGNAGPSAGGGGSGGCGGAPGKGGGAGGASIGLVSLGAKLAFVSTTITSKAGGLGGAGGAGQAGGAGGAGGQPGSNKGDGSAVACAGGKGGNGGAGGRGGGGRGGPSVGVAYVGDAPDTKGATITIGTPGDGGTGDGAKGTGAKGVSAETQAF